MRELRLEHRVGGGCDPSRVATATLIASGASPGTFRKHHPGRVAPKLLLRPRYPLPKPPRHHQADHPKVADERPERMPKRRRLVLLQHEMSRPSEPVPDG